MARVDESGWCVSYVRLFRYFWDEFTRAREREGEREREPRTVITRVGKSSGSVITSGRSPGGRGRNLSVGTASRRKGPAPIIWGAGCTMQTTTRDVGQMMCACLCIRLVSPNACRSIPVFLPVCRSNRAKLRIALWTNTELRCRDSCSNDLPFESIKTVRVRTCVRVTNEPRRLLPFRPNSPRFRRPILSSDNSDSSSHHVQRRVDWRAQNAFGIRAWERIRELRKKSR